MNLKKKTKDKKKKHQNCSSGPAVNIMHNGGCPVSLGNEYSMCEASAGCKWKTIFLPVSHHYSFWQLFKSVSVWFFVCFHVYYLQSL